MIPIQDTMHPQVMQSPRVRLVCGVDYLRDGPLGRVWQIGAMWDANPWPRLGSLIYRRQFIIRIVLDRGRY